MKSLLKESSPHVFQQPGFVIGEIWDQVKILVITVCNMPAYLQQSNQNNQQHQFHSLFLCCYIFNSNFKSIIFRSSSFFHILAHVCVINCGSHWGTFGRSSNFKLCQSTCSFICLGFFSPPQSPPHTHTPAPSLSHSISPFLSLSLLHTHSLSSHFLFTYRPRRCRCEIFKTHFVVWGQCTPSRWAAAEQTPMYANLNTKQPRMFSI